MNLMDMTAIEATEKIKNREISAKELVRMAADEIEKRDGEINSFITVDIERALVKAEEIQRKLKCGESAGLLAGLPVSVKDNICTKGMKTTCGSRMLYNFIPPYNAEVIDRLEASGAIIIGKTNMDEFAIGSTTESSYYGVTKNPINADFVAGGSSGGAAASVSCGEVLAALGSDTGGSVRQPSAFCGVTGIKPTYGTVSRFGLVAYGSSLEQIGTIGKDVRDAAALLQIISGHDSKDSTSVKREDYDFTSDFLKEADIRGMKIAVPVNNFHNTDPEIRGHIEEVKDILKDGGAVVEEVELDMWEYIIPAYYIIASAEVSSNLSRFDGVKYGYRTTQYEELHQMYKKSRSEGFGEEVKRRIMLGSFVLSSGYYDEYYLKALKVRKLISNEFKKLFEKYQVILTPVTPVKPWKLGIYGENPVKMYDNDIYTVIANLTGMPAISVPYGNYENGMTGAVQLMANCFDERNMIKVARRVEQSN